MSHLLGTQGFITMSRKLKPSWLLPKPPCCS